MYQVWYDDYEKICSAFVHLGKDDLTGTQLMCSRRFVSEIFQPQLSAVVGREEPGGKNPCFASSYEITAHWWF